MAASLVARRIRSGKLVMLPRAWAFSTASMSSLGGRRMADRRLYPIPGGGAIALLDCIDSLELAAALSGVNDFDGTRRLSELDAFASPVPSAKGFSCAGTQSVG